MNPSNWSVCVCICVSTGSGSDLRFPSNVMWWYSLSHTHTLAHTHHGPPVWPLDARRATTGGGERVWLVGHARRSCGRLDGPAGGGSGGGASAGRLHELLHTWWADVLRPLRHALPGRGLQDGATGAGYAAAGAGLLVILRGGAAGHRRSFRSTEIAASRRQSRSRPDLLPLSQLPERRVSGEHRRQAQAPAQLPHPRLRESLREDVTPQGAPALAQWRPAFRLQLAVLRQALHALGRAAAPPADAHRRQALRLQLMPTGLSARWPPGQTHARARVPKPSSRGDSIRSDRDSNVTAQSEDRIRELRRRRDGSERLVTRPFVRVMRLIRPPNKWDHSEGD